MHLFTAYLGLIFSLALESVSVNHHVGEAIWKIVFLRGGRLLDSLHKYPVELLLLREVAGARREGLGCRAKQVVVGSRWLGAWGLGNE